MKKVIVIVLIFVIIGILAGTAYMFLGTDLFKTPDQLFKKYLLTSIIDLTQAEYKPYNEILTKISEKQSDIKYIASDETEENKIEVNYLANPTDKNSKMNFNMFVEGNEYASISAIITEKIFGIQMKDIHDKYLALENRDLKKVAENFLPEEEVNKIPDVIIFPEKVTPEEKEKLKGIMIKYIAKINESITPDKYIVEKQVSTTIDSQSLVTDKYSLIMNENEFSKIILNTILELLNDQEFLIICESRVDAQNIENLKQSINTSLEELEKQTKQTQIKISIYVENKKTRKTEIISKTGSTEWFLIDNELESSFVVKNVLNKNTSNKIGQENILKINNKFENNNGTLTIEEKRIFNKKDVEKYKEESSSLFNNTSKYEDSETKTIIVTTVSDNLIVGEITFESLQNKDIESNDMEEKQEVYTTNKFEINFNPGLEIEQLNQENALILNDYTAEDYTNLGTELILNALKTGNEKPKSLIGSLSMYLAFFAPPQEMVDEAPSFEESSQNEFEESEQVENNEVIDIRNDIYNYVFDGLNKCLTEYKDEFSVNEEVRLEDYLTVENVQEECPENYVLELLDGITMKCIVNGADIYYITMNINGETLLVDELNVYTEEEYSNM